MQRQPARLRGETTTPANLQKLVETKGVTKAAKDLGISTTTIHKARITGAVSKVIEIAAEGLLRHATPPSLGTRPGPATRRASVSEVSDLNANHATTLYLIEVPIGSAPLVEKFAERLGAHMLKA